MPKLHHRTSLSRQLRFMSRRFRIRSLLFTFCWLLLALFCLSAMWKLFTVLFLPITTGWQDAHNQVDWSLWTPAVNLFDQPTWGIRQLWPVYVAKRILPQHGSTVFVFSSCSPFHDAAHLRDPRRIYEREQAQHLLLAVVQGLVNRIVWVYPYWQHRSAAYEFNRRTAYRVGLATIELPPDHNQLLSNPSDRLSERSSILSRAQTRTPIQPSVTASAVGEGDAPNLLNTICVCKENEHHCELPFLFPLSFSVPTDTCTRNATVLYEQVIDLLAESLLSPTSTPSGATSNKQTLRWHQVIYGFRSHAKPPVQWLANPVEPHKPLSHIVLLDANYFGSEPSVTAEPEFRPLWTPRFRGHPDIKLVALLPNTPSLSQFQSLLQLMFDEIMFSLSTMAPTAPVDWAHILRLGQLFVDSLFQLLPSDRHEPVLPHWNASTGPTCGKRSPSSVASPLSLDERADFSGWYARLSTPSTSFANICAKTELLALGVLNSVDPLLKPGESVVHLWRWLCQLDRTELLRLAEWIPCYSANYEQSSSAQTSSNRSTTRPTIRLCRRPSNRHYPLHTLDRNETKLLLIRLRNILHNLAIPRYIAMVNHSSTTSHVSFDPLRTLCAYISQMY